MRKLRITVTGRWYLALTIALGVVAMVSGNNALYLIESLLLSGLILSGILSERAVSAVRIDWLRGRAISGEPLPDRLRVTNPRGFTVFCVEVGEWNGSELLPLAYVPRLAPRSSLLLPVRRVAGARGKHRWQGFAVATRYPFGFARKIRVVLEPGERIVWPARAARSRNQLIESSARARLAGGSVTEGEIRPYDPEDDSRMIIWTLSAKGQGPVVRPRRRDERSPHVTLDLRAESGEAFEARVRDVARAFHEYGRTENEGMLILLGSGSTRRVRGRFASLDELALVKAEGQSPASTGGG